MQTLTDNQIAALRLFHQYTGGRYRLWNLAGPSNAGKRAAILSALSGGKVPKSKAGVYAMEAALYAVAKPAGECPAAREQAFGEWLKTTISELEWQELQTPKC